MVGVCFTDVPTSKTSRISSLQVKELVKALSITSTRHRPPTLDSPLSDTPSGDQLPTFQHFLKIVFTINDSTAYLVHPTTSCPSPSRPNNSSRSRIVCSTILERLRFTNGSERCSRSRLLRRKKLSRQSRVVGPFLQDQLSACGLIH
jgi:hypothetical protein